MKRSPRSVVSLLVALGTAAGQTAAQPQCLDDDELFSVLVVKQLATETGRSVSCAKRLRDPAVRKMHQDLLTRLNATTEPHFQRTKQTYRRLAGSPSGADEALKRHADAWAKEAFDQAQNQWTIRQCQNEKLGLEAMLLVDDPWTGWSGLVRAVFNERRPAIPRCRK